MVEHLADGYFSVANVISPLQPTLETNLYSIDPVIYWMTEYFKGVLDIHLTDRWNQAVSSIGRTDLTNLVVNEILPYDPLPFATDNQFRFPLMAVYRTKETYAQQTAGWYGITSNIDVLYILPPLASEQLEQMQPYLTQTVRILLDRTLNGIDSNYLDGLDVWKESGLQEIGLSNSTYGRIPGLDGGIYFPSVIMQFQVIERNMPLTSPIKEQQYPPFTGADIEIQDTDDAVFDDDNFKVELEEDL